MYCAVLGNWCGGWKLDQIRGQVRKSPMAGLYIYFAQVSAKRFSDAGGLRRKETSDAAATNALRSSMYGRALEFVPRGKSWRAGVGGIPRISHVVARFSGGRALRKEMCSQADTNAQQWNM
jgi:hypothetical protein